MAGKSPVDLTCLLRAWAAGDQGALNELIPSVYDELRRIARRSMRCERPGNTLQTTALIHEAYLRLMAISDLNWKDRAHFFAVSAQIVRRILIDAARARGSEKRGGGAVKVDLNESVDGLAERSRELLALDEALQSLAEFDPQEAKVVEYRFFGGLSVEETAEVLKISTRTVEREWALARCWLMREMSR